MKQTTLFDNQVQRLKCKTPSVEVNLNEPKLKQILYKPSSTDKEVIDGFDESIKDWIYPINFPLRDYQLQIVQECLFKNTLVCLPTGLGKTFIASVVMYNFYRWYPSGKIIFVAPTRPLVHQQMYACQDTIPIESTDIVEMTGSINQNLRTNLWKDKRVFFLTAQVLVNDLISNICPGESIVFIVLDEAHKASKNHAYCQIIRELTNDVHGNRNFRILGLSATPGDEITTIQDVIQNLLISHIELRTDECKDIKIYSHDRLVEECIVSLGPEVIKVRDQILNICSPVVERLKRAGAINSSHSNSRITKYGLLKMKEEYKSRSNGCMSRSVLSDFAQAISLYYAVELVQQHGLKPMFLYFANAINNSQNMPQIVDLMTNEEFMKFYNSLEKLLNSENFITGHPKLVKLLEIVESHFIKKTVAEQQTSRVIIFSQIRDSVDEIIKLLKKMEPLIRPIAFMGKTKNVSQREQMDAMRLFSEGKANVLVSTCIGEEGLDIGEVDLIICFDSQKSPLRLIQRAGRTGRKRKGRVVMLLSEGKEVNNYRTSLNKKARIHSAIFEGYKHLVFYPENPRMVPLGIEPIVSFQKVSIPKRIKPIVKTSIKKFCKELPMIECNVKSSQPPILNIDAHICDGMRFLNEPTAVTGTISQRYLFNRHKKSFYQTLSTINIGHSDLTKDFISIIKLKEMHKRGKTNIIFHLSSSRVVDIDEPMTESDDESNQKGFHSYSFSLSSNTSESMYQPIETLRKIVDSISISPFIAPIHPTMTTALFNSLIEDVELNKPDILSAFDHQMEKFNTDLNSETNESMHSLRSFSNGEDISFGETEISNQSILSPTKDDKIEENSLKPKSNIVSVTNCPISPLKNSSNHLMNRMCTSTPISSLPKILPLKSILNSFNIPQNISRQNTMKNQILLQSFKIPISSEVNQSVFVNSDKPNTSSMFEKSQMGIESALDCFNVDSLLSCEISSDLFDDDDNFSFDDDNDDDNEIVFQEKDNKLETKSITESSTNGDKIVDADTKVLSLIPVNDDATVKSDEDLFSDDMDIFSPFSDDISISSNDGDKSVHELQNGNIGISSDNVDKSNDKPMTIHDINDDNNSDLSDSFLITKSHPNINRSRSPSFDSSFCSDNDDKPSGLDNNKSPLISNLPRKKINPVKDFFLSQAMVSDNRNGWNDDNDDEDDNIDDDEDEQLESSFIDDSDNYQNVNTQIHQMYIQSIKSPLMKAPSSIPLLTHNRNTDFVYSQQLISDDDYLMDSFVVPDSYKTPPRKKRNRRKIVNDTSPIPSKKFKRLTSLNDSIR